jgi:hypothetical protein
MTNTIAIWLGLLIITFFVLDHYVFQLGALTVVTQLLILSISKLAVWR